MTNESCETCRYSYQEPAEWECRRHAPRVVPGMYLYRQFPKVFRTDWCGEYTYMNEKK